MHSREIFVAFDGSEFDNEIECKEYESNLILEEIEGKIKMYDSFGYELKDITKRNLMDATTIFFATDESVKLLKSLCIDYFEIYLEGDFEDAGAYEWNEKMDEFYKVDSILQELENRVNTLENTLSEYRKFLEEVDD